MRRFRPLIWSMLDVALAAVLIMVAEVEIATSATYSHAPVWPGPAAVTRIAVVLLVAPILLRRIRPLLGLVLASAVLVANLLLLGAIESGVGFVLLVVIVYSGAAHLASRWPTAVAAAVLLATVLTRPGAIGGVGDVVFFVGLVVLSFVLGRAVQLRQRQIATLQRQRLELERLHAVEVASATAAERSAIARELHDIVAHAVSVVVIQAQAGQRMLERDPARSGEALRTIEASGRAALVELRRLLTVLDPDDSGDATSPTPSVANLDDVVQRLRATGLVVELEQDALPPLPAATELAIHRTVQESLTNALKHAPGQPVLVRIRAADHGDRIDITVENPIGAEPSTVPGAARGLIGLRERLALVGGTFAAGADSGRFRVRATVPVDAGLVRSVS